MQVADLYKKVNVKVERLLTLVSLLAERWLQKQQQVKVSEGCCITTKIK